MSALTARTTAERACQRGIGGGAVEMLIVHDVAFRFDNRPRTHRSRKRISRRNQAGRCVENLSDGDELFRLGIEAFSSREIARPGAAAARPPHASAGLKSRGLSCAWNSSVTKS